MASFKPDITNYSSLTEAYQNYRTLTQNISVSGVVANGATSNFSVSFDYDRPNSRADTYIKSSASGSKVLANSGSRFSASFENVYQFTSSEVATRLVSYTASAITVTVSITNNTGASITLVTQTLQVMVVIYDAPFA